MTLFSPCHKKKNPHQKCTSRKCQRKLKFSEQLYYKFFCWPEFFFHKRFCWPELLLTRNFCWPEILQNFLLTKIFCWPNIFDDLKFSLSKDFCSPKIFANQNFFYQIFFAKLSLTKHCHKNFPWQKDLANPKLFFDQKLFFDKKSFLANNVSWPTIFYSNFFNKRNFLTKFLLKKNVDKNFPNKIFWPYFFCQKFFFTKSFFWPKIFIGKG